MRPLAITPPRPTGDTTIVTLMHSAETARWVLLKSSALGEGEQPPLIHRFDNLGNKDVKQLAAISPSIMGPAYFREAAEVINTSTGGPPDRKKMMDGFHRHGMTLAAPPSV
jgi:hypothetical protein